MVQPTSADVLVFGDGQEYYEDGEIASWRDVFYYCYYYMKKEWLSVTVHIILFIGLAYAFFAGIVLLGISTQILGGCYGSSLIDNASNPLAAAMAGIIAASLFQSSTLANILIGTLVGTTGMSVQYGIYMAMGASVGNSVTSSIIALAHISDKNILERAVAGSSVNNIYYFLTIAILLPVEIATKILFRIGEALVPDTVQLNYEWGGLVNLIIHPLTNLLIIPNPVRHIRIEKSFMLCVTKF